MAITGPNDLPVILKVDSDPIKAYVFAQLGYGSVNVELSDAQLEICLRVTGDWIAGYFPREQRFAVFNTEPLRSTYPLPSDAYWVQEVSWDPVTTRLDNVFGAEAYLFNIGQVSGIQQLLTDYHLLQAYRKFSRKLLATEGHWEVVNEVNGDTTEQLIRLYPTPKGVFPVVVVYYPVVTQFRSAQAKLLCYEMLLAEAKVMLGSARRKISGMPSPDGGRIEWDGEALMQEGLKAKEEITQKAINLGEPLGIYTW